MRLAAAAAVLISHAVLAAPPTDLPESVSKPLAVLNEGENTADNLKSTLAALDQAIASGSLSPRHSCLAQTYRALSFLRLGDMEKTEDAKLKQYEQGQEASKRAVAADGSCAAGHYYLGATMGKWGETKGVFKAMFMVDDIKKEFKKAIELDPSFLDAKLALGQVEKAVPGIMGGSKERAEALYREVLAKEPAHTRAMLELAELLKDDGKKDEALKLANAVVAHASPSRPWEWRKFDRARAEKLVAALQR